MTATRRSQDHGGIDGGGVVTIRTSAFDAFIEVSRAARGLLYDKKTTGWYHINALKEAVDKLAVELGED